MKDNIPITPPMPTGLKIKWNGIFDLDLTYKKMKQWIDFRGYGDNFEEEEYSQAERGENKDIGLRWYAEKSVGAYFAYVIELDFRLTKIKDAEIERNGRKIKVNHGNFELRLAATLVKDKNDKYKIKFVQRIYETIVKNRIDEHSAQLYGEVYEFQEFIKKIIGMQ